MNYVNLSFERIDATQKGKSKYLVDNCEVFAERAVMHHYKKNGYQSIWSENYYWWQLIGLLFWDVIFARVEGAVIVSKRGYEDIIYPEDDEFEKLYQITVKNNGMPADLFTSDFFENREELIDNRVKELLNADVCKVIESSFKKHYGQNFRMIEDWDRFKVEELMIVAKLIPIEKLIKIMERILRNVRENRSGFPDLVIYNDHELFFSEVKSENDKLSEQQKDWISFLESLGFKLDLCLINHSEKQISNLKKKGESSKLVKISFGQSTSKKREDAIAFAQLQKTYFIQGEGKEQTYGAVFDVKDIIDLYKMLDLTSGWKSQQIELDGKQVSSSELRNSLWCYKRKIETGASLDYCKVDPYSNEKNLFGCTQIDFDIDDMNQYGYIDTDIGEWIFDRKKLSDHIAEITRKLSNCPLFDDKKLLQYIDKLPDKINPKVDIGWAFKASDYRTWFYHKDNWYNHYGESNFPGFAAMIGIVKISRKDINEALSYSRINSERDAPYSITLTNSKTSHKQKQGCFIATAVYGDYDAPEVQLLRKYRDMILNKSYLGRKFITVYYDLSPGLARWIGKRKLAIKVIKSILSFFIEYVKKSLS